MISIRSLFSNSLFVLGDMLRVLSEREGEKEKERRRKNLKGNLLAQVCFLSLSLNMMRSNESYLKEREREREK